MCYNIPTKTDFHCMEMEAFSGLLEATCKTFSTLKGYIIITQQRLKEIFKYDAEEGKLIRVQKPVNQHRSGRKVHTQHIPNGYVRLGVEGKVYMEHRLIFLMLNGYLPEFIDHINGNKLDNRVENLREITKSQNSRNEKLRANNTSGQMGVNFDKNSSKWVARIQTDKGRLMLGRFKNKDEAIRVRKDAEIKYGYSPTHGRIT